MRNEFDKEKLKTWFTDNHTCFWCGESGFDAFHHILGRKSNSILNASPLHNEKCHIYNGKLNTQEARSILLCKTVFYLSFMGYSFSKEDTEFFNKYKSLYDYNKEAKFQVVDYLKEPAIQLLTHVSNNVKT